jgi:exonuclease III
MGKSKPLDSITNPTLNPEQKPEPKPEPRQEHKTESKKRRLNIATWNIRRGLVTRENELVDLLTTEEIDVIFITETDVRRGNVSGYKIAGFTTHLQNCNSDEDQVRIVALVKEDLCLNLKLREDLMNTAFPSIWLEIQDTFKSPTLIGGFYRQWSNGTKLTIPEQVEEIEIFCDQICRANSQTNCKLVITGDANLCADSWEDDDYDRKSTSQPLL